MKHEPVKDHAERKRISALIERCEKEQTMSDDEFKNFDREDLILLIECQKERIGELLADRPQGEWIDEADKYDASFGIHDYRCSNCNSYADEYIGGHEWYTAGKPNFCPYCGADMRERESE
jgi:rubrerythrin